MVALRDWFSFTSYKRVSEGKTTVFNPKEFANRVYKETNGATPELKKLMRDYREKKASGKLVVRGPDIGGKR